MNIRSILDFFRDQMKGIGLESLCFLKKQRMDKSILLMKDSKVEKITPEEFYHIFEVEYLPSLFINDLKTLKKIVTRCRNQIRAGAISEKEIWQGTYFEDNIKNFPTSPVYIKWINERKGYGLFALYDLKKDTYIGEYTGQIRKFRRRQDNKNSYCFEYQIGEAKRSHYTIDAKYMGNVVRFINHDYFPNLTTLAAYSNQIIHIILKTSQFIPKDTELTYDYGPRYWKDREKPL
jgi:uncharacterized protein